MDISEVVKRSGLPPSTLRYYEDRGLIAPIGRHGLKRQFNPLVLDQLSMISLGKAAGFSLDEIAHMFTSDKRPNIDRGMLQSKAEQVDATIRRLRAMSNGLKHAARCPHPSHMECPSFRRLLKAASEGALGNRPMTGK